LSLSTEDFARGPRRWFLVQAAGLLVFFVGVSLTSGDLDLLGSGAIASAAHALIVGLAVGADRDGMALVHWSTGRRFSLLKPGALRGYLLSVGTAVVSGAVYCAFAVGRGGAESVPATLAIAAPAFAIIYLAAPQLLARWIPHLPTQTALMVRVLALGLFVLGVGLPPLLGELFSDASDVGWNLLNPALGLANIARARNDALPLLLLPWAAAVGLGSWAYFVLRRRDLEPAR
jgi:hypothetical protein